MPSGFHMLLSQLDPDSARAAEQFERLRRKLVRYFESRRAVFAEDAADETIQRVARRLESGTSVRDVEAFAAGTARRVLHESRRGAHRLRLVPLEEATPSEAAPEPPERDPDPRPARLRRSLEALPGESRALLLAYYVPDEKVTRIEARRRLARQWRLCPSTLRTRVQRLRERVESELRRAS